jgi:hypothetical protein
MWKEAAVAYLEGLWIPTRRSGRKQLWHTYGDCRKQQNVAAAVATYSK